MRINLSLLIISISALVTSDLVAGVVNVYSERIEELVKPAFEAFEKKSGIKVKLMTGKAAGMIERIKMEGENTTADLLITVDAGNLWLAKSKYKILQSVNSNSLNSQIPASLRDKDGYWYGLTVRARTIVYNKDKVKPSDLSTYEDLGNPKWKGKICLRTSKKVYNKSLVATMIKSIGKSETEKVLKSWMNNKPIIHAKDSHLLKGIAEGQCDIGLVNTYYLGRELKKDAKFPVGLFWANQKDRGVHVNISGGGVTKYAKNKDNAVKLLEYLSSSEAQNLFADNNLEYPVNRNVSPAPELDKWWGATFKMDPVNVAAAGELQSEAVKLMAKVGYK